MKSRFGVPLAALAFGAVLFTSSLSQAGWLDWLFRPAPRPAPLHPRAYRIPLRGDPKVSDP